MQRYYDTLLEEQRGPFVVILDKTWEDLHPNDCFDDSVTDIKEICDKIDRGSLDWFMLRCRVMFEGVELASDYIGGFLYEDAREILKDGVAEDIIEETLRQAREAAVGMKAKFEGLKV
jgi:hypothetical protein